MREDMSGYMKVSEAARRLNVTRRDLYYHIKTKQIVSIVDEATGLFLIHRNELLKFKYGKHYDRLRQGKIEREKTNE